MTNSTKRVFISFKIRLLSHIFLLSLFFFPDGMASAAENKNRMIPDEYESGGGIATGLNNSGVASYGSISAIRINPALLPFDPQYSVSTTYHWPATGREYYQIGVLDSITSKIAAAVLYTGFNGSFNGYDKGLDSPLKQRAIVALGGIVSKVSLGINGHFLRVSDNSSDVKRGFALGAGLAGLLTENVKVGIAVENLTNQRQKLYAPRVIRGGIGFLMLGGDVTGLLDFQDRERIDFFENSNLYDFEKKFQGSEQMIIGSLIARVMNIVRLTASYGHSVSNDKKQMIATSIGLVQQHFSLTYGFLQRSINTPIGHNAFDLNLLLSF